jgi:hypothetical protein
MRFVYLRPFVLVIPRMVVKLDTNPVLQPYVSISVLMSIKDATNKAMKLMKHF